MTMFSLTAAAPHTATTVRARKIDDEHMTFANSSDVHDDEFDVPAQQFHWMVVEDMSGEKVEYRPISYSELAALPTFQRRRILSSYAQRLINGKRELDEALVAQGIQDADRGSHIYATVGHHHKVQREVDGFGRGPQSNPTVHHSVTFFPRNEHIERSRRVKDMQPDELLKDIDPLSSIFFEATKEPIRSVMENTLVNYFDQEIKASVDIFHEDGGHEEPFPFGWKINFGENSNVPLEQGMDLFIHFVSRMKNLWDDGRELGKDPENEGKQENVAKVAGDEAVDIFSTLMEPIEDRIEKETKNITTLLRGLEGKDDDSANILKEIYKFLIQDSLSDHPRFTLPGDAPFNVLYKINPVTGCIIEADATFAGNERGIAERITGAHYEREARI